MAAEALAVNGLNTQLCLALGSLYSNEINQPIQVQQQQTSKVFITFPCIYDVSYSFVSILHESGVHSVCFAVERRVSTRMVRNN